MTHHDTVSQQSQIIVCNYKIMQTITTPQHRIASNRIEWNPLCEYFCHGIVGRSCKGHLPGGIQLQTSRGVGKSVGNMLKASNSIRKLTLRLHLWTFLLLNTLNCYSWHCAKTLPVQLDKSRRFEWDGVCVFSRATLLSNVFEGVMMCHVMLEGKQDKI